MGTEEPEKSALDATKNSQVPEDSAPLKPPTVPKPSLYPIYIREYKLCEIEFLRLAQTILINDQNIDAPLSASADLLIKICSNIEGMAKELHFQLAPKYPECEFPFDDKEHFDFHALRFLDKALGLAFKHVYIYTDLVVLSKETRDIVPLFNASKFDHEDNSRPLWCYAYQDCKHDRGNLLNTPDSKISALALIQALGALYILCLYGYYFHYSKRIIGEPFLVLREHEVCIGEHPLPLQPLNSQVFLPYSFRPYFSFSDVRDADEPISNNTVSNIKTSSLAILIIKDNAQLLRSLWQQNIKLHAILEEEQKSHPEFVAFAKDPRNRIGSSKAYPLMMYANRAQDPNEKAWAMRLVEQYMKTASYYISILDTSQKDAELKLQGQSPLVFLNTYTHARLPNSSKGKPSIKEPEALIDDLYQYDIFNKPAQACTKAAGQTTGI